MKFIKMNLGLLRTKLEKNVFYEDVTFENKEVKKSVEKVITEWIFYLEKYKGTKIERFRELFSELHEVAFPIKIKNCYSYSSLEIIIVDNEGKEYYMSKRCIYNYDELETYIIGRRNNLLEPLVDRYFHYKISKDKTIILIETGVMQLKPDGTNGDIVVNFHYDYEKNTTEAELELYTSTNKIKIEYLTKKDKFDKKVLEFLFDINEKNWYYYDVFPILKWILLNISDEDISLSITAKVENEICSEIDIVNGIVQKYTKTEIISEGEVRTSKVIFAKQLEEFLTENS